MAEAKLKNKPVRVAEKSEIKRKKERITAEIDRLSVLFDGIDENKKKLVRSMVEEVAFMTVTMQDLQEEIAENGTTDEYKNGANQYGRKQSAAALNFLQFSQKKTAAMKILLDQLPKTEAKRPDADDFDSFVYSRDEI